MADDDKPVEAPGDEFDDSRRSTPLKPELPQVDTSAEYAQTGS